MIFFRVLVALISGEFEDRTYQFLEPVTARPSVCIIRDVPVDVLSGIPNMQEARCLDAEGMLIYVGYVREVSNI